MLAMGSVVIGYANRFVKERIDHIFDERGLRKLRPGTWVMFEVCSSGGKERFCCKMVSIVN